MMQYRKLTGTEIMQLKPGDWVAWRTERGKPIGPSTKWVEAQLADSPVRCYQVVSVLLESSRTQIEKDRLYRPPAVVGIDIIHEVWDYDS